MQLRGSLGMKEGSRRQAALEPAFLIHIHSLPSASFTRTSTAAPSRRLWGLLWNVMHHQLPHAAAKNRGGRDSKAALFWSAHQRFYLQADAHSQQGGSGR